MAICSDALYKLSQLELIELDDEIHTYITIDRVGAADEDVIKHLFDSGYLDETRNVVAGRIALRSYYFSDDAGIEVEAPQIAGVKVERGFQQQGAGHQHQLLAYEEMFQGTVSSIGAHTRVLVYRALQLNVAALIVGHNHPSFLNEPSRSDIAKTGRLKRHLSWSL